MRVDACVACDRARDGRIERDGCCVTDAPLSHTHIIKIEDPSLMYTQRIGICLCLTHAQSFAHSHLFMSVSHAHRLHIALPPQHTYGHIHTFSLSHIHSGSLV